MAAFSTLALLSLAAAGGMAAGTGIAKLLAKKKGVMAPGQTGKSVV